ncbi:MAG: ZIP family metal transporter [Bacillota bacterium]|jgi:ZIP family zinc transporter
MAYWASTLAGACTLLGALLVLALGEPRRPTLAAVLGLAGGIMVGVTVLDLIPAALKLGRPETVFLGILLGILSLALLDNALSSLVGPSRSGFLKTGLLVGLGIGLHDLPEGMALAAGFTGTTNLGLFLALTIGLHNIPEGMATAVPLRAAGVSRRLIIPAVAALSLVTPLGTFIGFGLVQVSALALGLLMAFAAGAMLYISLFELTPRAVSLGFKPALAGAAAGAALVWWAGLLF